MVLSLLRGTLTSLVASTLLQLGTLRGPLVGVAGLRVNAKLSPLSYFALCPPVANRANPPCVELMPTL